MVAAESRPMFVALEWIEAHDVVPDGARRGEPFRLYDFQGQYLRNFYLVRGDAEVGQLAPAFVHRRGILVGPQKVGKNPLIAAQVTLEAVGPALFAGFAGSDDAYRCRDHGCPCGWTYDYDAGEPMGMTWPTPLVQITAVSEEATQNTYDVLRPMIELGPLADIIPKTGEEFIRLPGGGRIDVVTSSAQSRLGQRTTFVAQDEVGLYTKRNGMTRVADTQYRGLSGMGGRSSLTTNAWDPSDHSVAQDQFESGSKDVYRQFTQPPKNLSYGNKRERHKIHQLVYPTDTRRENGGHVDLASIEAEAAELYVRDPAQAERFFGNGLVQGAGKAFDIARWNDLRVTRLHPVPDKALIVIGGDGSRLWDDMSLIATEVASGYQWPLGIWHPGGPGKEVPFDQVDAILTSAMETYDVWRVYLDPPYIESWIATWAGRWGDDRVIEWWTNRPKALAYALRAWTEAMRTGDVSHCPVEHPYCAMFSEHVGNAIRHETGYRDDGGQLWTVEKEVVTRKIDSVLAATLSWEARNDALAAGVLNVEEFTSVYESRGLIEIGAPA